MMKLNILLAVLFTGLSAAYAQEDPTVMTIAGEPISRSEFEYSYNKSNVNGETNTMAVAEYVNNFIDYKLKVIVAKEAHLDTLASFKKLFAYYDDNQMRQNLSNDTDIDKKAHDLYDKARKEAISKGGLVKVEHVFVPIKQDATTDEERSAEYRIDSIYDALRQGTTFNSLAEKYSNDKKNPVVIKLSRWFTRGDVLKELEDEAFALQPGDMSSPFLSPVGWHIILLKDKRNFLPYDSVRSNIITFVEQKGLREQIINTKSSSTSKVPNPRTAQYVMFVDKDNEMKKVNPNFKYLIQEYHDGLLICEISNRVVWDKARKDEKGMKEYFNKNKKKYNWDTPKFKGIYYRVKKKNDVKAVKDVIKHLPFDEWENAIQNTFNKGPVKQVCATIHFFELGDNSFVDRKIFKRDVAVTLSKDYPIEAVYGKRLKKPETMTDVQDFIIADYEEELENEWIKSLRKKYQVVINKNVLATVNKH